jgi:HEAT repeat protein
MRKIDMTTRNWMALALTVLLIAGTAATAQSQGTAVELYDQAREALNDRDYSNAAELFGRVADEYPESRQAPEALYWRAFALMREGGRRDLLAAKRSLERQFERYPDQARDGDSAELAIRIQSRLAEQGDAKAAEEILRLADQLSEEGGLDREEETRMAALHALLQVEPERALPILRKVLVENPQKYSSEFRNQALFMVSQAGDEDEALEILLHVARNDQSDEIRGQAVFWLSQTRSDRAVAILDELLSDPSEDDEVRESAVFALSQIGGGEAMTTLRRVAADESVDVEIRANAIFWLGQMGSEDESAKFLIDLYAELDDVELKDKVIFAVAQGGARGGGDFLMGIVRDPDEDVDLRNNALFWLGQTDRIDEEELVAMISTLDDPELAEQVVFVLSQRGGDAAVEALIELARSAEDPEIREKAIFWLGQSGDPRAAEYLEELIGEDW